MNTYNLRDAHSKVITLLAIHKSKGIHISIKLMSSIAIPIVGIPNNEK